MGDYIILKTIVKTMEGLNLEYPPLDGNVEEFIKELNESR